MSTKKPAADQKADSKAWTAVQHKTMPGPRVMKTSVFKKHLEHCKGNSIFIELGTAATQALALELCKASKTI